LGHARDPHGKASERVEKVAKRLEAFANRSEDNAFPPEHVAFNSVLWNSRSEVWEKDWDA
jgi:hypothetical protein